MRLHAPLDWLNFFLADVKDGLGPFLAIYLLSSQHWEPGKIGVVMMIAGVATVAARAPFGAFVDWTRGKRGLMVAAAVAVAVGARAMSLLPNFWLIAGASIWAALAIDPGAIDHDLARGSDKDRAGQPSELRGVWARRSATRSPDTSSTGPAIRRRFCFSGPLRSPPFCCC